MNNSLVAQSGLGTDEDLEVMTHDSLYNGIGIFLLLLVLMLTLVSPLQKEEADEEVVPPGSITIEATWPDDLNMDIDLWVAGPRGDPVGYSNKGGEHYNLVRDDLGRVNPDDVNNYENTFSRGIPAGKHCVNLHLYNDRGGKLPVIVTVTVTISKTREGTKGTSGSPPLTTQVELKEKGQEINAFCFMVNKEGDIPPGEDSVFQSQAIRLRNL